VELPEAFVRTVRQHVPDDAAPGHPASRPDGKTWLAALPRLAAAALERWRLRRDPAEPVRWGYTALVLPVLRPHGDPGMLKLGWPHPEADVEHLALRAWRGTGAVRLLAAEPADNALLLERLDATRDLTTGPVPGTSEALGTVLARLDRPATPWAPPLSDHLRRLARRIDLALADAAAAHRFPRRLLQHAASLARDLVGEDGLDGRLVHTDLHQANVLWRPDPGEWVAIDPKVEAGDPHWAVAPALWNRWDDALAAPDLAGHLLLRLDLVCDAAGLDRDRARVMSLLRLTDNALAALVEGRGDAAAEVTRAVAVIKAMQRG
jgi:streptomycin 6-kinase